VISKHCNVNRKRAEKIYEDLRQRMSQHHNGNPIEYLNVEWCDELKKIVISAAGPY
jgi:hypothetical protein